MDKRTERRGHFAVIVTPDEFKLYDKIASRLPPYVDKFWIVDKWTDSDGNIWYKVNAAGTGGGQGYKSQGLYKLSNKGTVMERAIVILPFGSEYDPSQYPTAIDPSDYAEYRILYRAGD